MTVKTTSLSMPPASARSLTAVVLTLALFAAGGLTILAQVPNAPQSAVQIPPAYQFRTNPAVAVPPANLAPVDLTTHSMQRQLPPRPTNSIVNSVDVSTNPTAITRQGSTITVANPAPPATNAPREEVIETGLLR